MSINKTSCFTEPKQENNKNGFEVPKTIKLYRAVGVEEYLSIMKIGKFALREGRDTVKYFGLDFEETLLFANKAFNNSLVAVFEVEIKHTVLNKIGDFTNVDPFLFKKGTVEIQEEVLEDFNKAILKVCPIF
ncbi:MAG: hypothetical protein FWG68_03945 [Defluviitaleaceae bacterium]|nr:hypothetical protein [Defluviitaleaceae bacterium]